MCISSEERGDGAQLTLHIVFGIRVRRLVVVDHLHNLQQVVLVELLQAIGELVHINLGGAG
jgi:hypothetical protein